MQNKTKKNIEREEEKKKKKTNFAQASFLSNELIFTYGMGNEREKNRHIEMKTMSTSLSARHAHMCCLVGFTFILYGFFFCFCMHVKTVFTV